METSAAAASEPITLEFDNKLADHLAAERLFYQSTFWSKGDKVVAVLLFLCGIFCIATIGVRWWTVLFFLIAIVEWFSWLDPHYFRVRLSFRQNSKFRETYYLTFSDAGIHFKTKSVESNLAWTHYRRSLGNQKVILLVYGNWMYTVIPTRAFADAEKLNAFRSLIHQKIVDNSNREV